MSYNQELKRDGGKPEPSLVPPAAILAMARVRRYGIDKYGAAESWRDVEPHRWLDAALRHIYAHLNGEIIDPESGLPHLWHALTSLALFVAGNKEKGDGQMTKEETISVLEQAERKVGIKWRNGRPEVYISPYLQEAINFALTKLHPVSREQVEKVWRGEWLNFYNDFSTAECSKCGELYDVSDTDENSKVLFDAFKKYYKFCPNCGAPMTDEAVEMVMKKLEGMG